MEMLLRHATLVLLLTFVERLEAKVLQFYIEPQQKVLPNSVIQLVEGRLEKFDQGMRQTASVSLVYDGGYYIMFDSPSATDLEAKAQMLRGLTLQGLVPGQVQLVVNSHGHPDHFGQGNFFPNARHFFGAYEYSGSNYVKTELSSNDTMRLTTNSDLWNTPGHTSNDISLVVRNVPSCGTIAIVGDLFYSIDDVFNSTTWDNEAWSPSIGHYHRQRVLCAADFIIPGHGKTFKVTNAMRAIANCSRIQIPSTLPSMVTSTFVQTQQQTSTTTQPTTSYTPSQTFYVDLSGKTTTPFPSYVFPSSVVFNKYTTSASPIAVTPPPSSSTTTTTSTTPVYPHVTIHPFRDADINAIANMIANDEQMMKAIQLSQLDARPSGNSVTKGGPTDLENAVIAPVIETAAQSLAKVLNLHITQHDVSRGGAVQTANLYPYTELLRRTLKRLSSTIPQTPAAAAAVPSPLPGLAPPVMPSRSLPNTSPPASPSSTRFHK